MSANCSVEAVQGDAFQSSITLSVREISMQDLGRSCHVRYNHVGSHQWGTPSAPALVQNPGNELRPRQLEVAAQLFQLGYSPNVPERLPIFPAPSTNLSFVPANISRYVLHSLSSIPALVLTPHLP